MSLLKSAMGNLKRIFTFDTGIDDLQVELNEKFKEMVEIYSDHPSLDPLTSPAQDLATDLYRKRGRRVPFALNTSDYKKIYGSTFTDDTSFYAESVARAYAVAPRLLGIDEEGNYPMTFLDMEDDYAVYPVERLVRETNLAWLMVIEGREIWLPKSKCCYRRLTNEVAVPDWIAVDRGMNP